MWVTKDKEKTVSDKKMRQLRNNIHQARSKVAMYKKAIQMFKFIEGYGDHEVSS